MSKPLKRHPALVALSKDHHFGLLLCWKIRTGIKKEVSTDRIVKYVEYFYNDHLKNHFEEEEKYIFSLLDENEEGRKKAERQHRKIKRLIEKLSDAERAKITLGQIEELLDTHIRFEERELFPYLQNSLESETLYRLKETVDAIHETKPDVWEDQFWEKQA